MGVIGPNGGGKTTLLKVILGMIQPMKGVVEFLNESIGKGKRRIGYLPQTKQFDKKFPIRVIDVVLSGLMSDVRLFHRFSKDDMNWAEEILNTL